MQSDNPDEVFLPKRPTKKKPISVPNFENIPKMPDRATHITEDNFDTSIIYSEGTIANYMLPIVTDVDDVNYYEQEMLANMYSIIHIMESIERTNTMYLMIVRTTFMQLKYLCRLIGFMRLKPSFLLLVKSLFHRYIAVLGHTELVDIYDEIFNDKLYSGDNTKYVFVPTLTDEWRMARIKEYHENLQQMYIRKMSKKTPPAYEVGEIIGAKDKEGRWWMSKVLARYEYQGWPVYYVEFINWGDKFNEFIADGFRLRKYNPKIHKYFRPAWAGKGSLIKPIDAEVETETETVMEEASTKATKEAAEKTLLFDTL